jgi:nitroimidazol reductase NimA-like FMN-containing flavoprotein (pyridoxamine 5'-phosphate oxidase superfamily)
MTPTLPIVELHEPYSDDRAAPLPWEEATAELAAAGVCWLSTLRPDGRPHVTPVATVWIDGAVCFSTGPGEVKSRNLAHSRHVVIMTGCNDFREGRDVVVEGDAVRVRDQSTLGRLCDAFQSKYDDFFGFRVVGDGFEHDAGGRADVYRVEAAKAFAYTRGTSYAATRYRFRVTSS